VSSQTSINKEARWVTVAIKEFKFCIQVYLTMVLMKTLMIFLDLYAKPLNLIAFDSVVVRT